MGNQGQGSGQQSSLQTFQNLIMQNQYAAAQQQQRNQQDIWTQLLQQQMGGGAGGSMFGGGYDPTSGLTPYSGIDAFSVG
jgi:hypothetical protein